MGFDRCAFHCSTRHSNSANDKRRQRFIGMDADVSQFLLKLYRAGRDSVREFSGLMPHLIEAHRNSRLLQLRLLVSAAQAEQRRTTLRTVRAAALHQYRADILRIGPRRASALTPTVSAGRQLSREAAHRFQLALCEGRCAAERAGQRTRTELQLARSRRPVGLDKVPVETAQVTRAFLVSPTHAPHLGTLQGTRHRCRGQRWASTDAVERDVHSLRRPVQPEPLNLPLACCIDGRTELR